MAWRVPRVAVIAVFVTVVILLTYLSREKLPYYQTKPIPPEPVVEVPRYETWGIKDLGEVIQVSSVRVRTSFSDGILPVKQDANINFIFTDINLTQPLPDLRTEVTTIAAERHQVPDASYMLVGLATQLNRLRDSLPAFTNWASGTNVHFVVLVAPPEPGGATIEEIQSSYERQKIRITLIESPLPWYEQYVSLIAVLYDHSEPSTKWACIMDDDTYFFSMKRILAMLSKYDSNEPYYIGGLSENKETINRNGVLAYGGGGVFYSIPLLKQLRPHVDICMDLPEPAGDLRIGHCITTYTLTKFTWEHHLFQMDLHGDVTGFYEAPRTRPLSTHHWKTWHFHDMAKVGAVGNVCGNECVLQKYVTSDGWMLTNGFSVVKYSYSEKEYAQYIEGAMEHTWADTIWVIPTSWNYTLAPLRPKDPGKIQYVIEKVDEDNDSMTIYYVRRKDGLGQGIIRMIWEKESIEDVAA